MQAAKKRKKKDTETGDAAETAAAAAAAATNGAQAGQKLVAESYTPPDPGPYPQDKPPENPVRFTPVQVSNLTLHCWHLCQSCTSSNCSALWLPLLRTSEGKRDCCCALGARWGCCRGGLLQSLQGWGTAAAAGSVANQAGNTQPEACDINAMNNLWDWKQCVCVCLWGFCWVQVTWT